MNTVTYPLVLLYNIFGQVIGEVLIFLTCVAVKASMIDFPTAQTIKIQ